MCLQGLSPKTAANAATFRVTRSSRRLQRSWRRFVSQHKSTAQLAQDFAAQGVANLDQDQEEGPAAADPTPEPQAQEAEAPPSGFVMIGGVGSIKSSSKHECFEDFAKKLQSPVTIKAAQVRILPRLYTVNWQSLGQWTAPSPSWQAELLISRAVMCLKLAFSSTASHVDTGYMLWGC